jgi:hypothetical protein
VYVSRRHVWKSGHILIPFLLKADTGQRSVVSLNALAALNSVERELLGEQEYRWTTEKR